MCYRPSLCVEWSRIFQSINKSSGREEQVLEYSTQISILPFHWPEKIRLLCKQEVQWAWLLSNYADSCRGNPLVLISALFIEQWLDIKEVICVSWGRELAIAYGVDWSISELVLSNSCYLYVILTLGRQSILDHKQSMVVERIFKFSHSDSHL